MTCAGVGSLLMADDYPDALQVAAQNVAAGDMSAEALNGLHWLEQGDNSITVPSPGTRYQGYDLFSLERVGHIVDVVARIASDTERIGADMGEIGAVAEQSSSAAEQVSATTQETSASAHDIVASARELSATAGRLEQLAARFEL